MEFAKDEVFNVRYNKLEDKLEYAVNTKKEGRIRSIFKKHKFITYVTLIGIAFSIFNIILISQFFKVLARI